MTFNTHVCIIISSIPSNTIDYVRINEKKKTMRFNTSLLHAGVTKETNGSTLPPVYQTSAFEQESAADLEKIFENKAPGYCYTRVANPTITAFENRITKLEGRNSIGGMRIRHGGADEYLLKYTKQWR